jgi:maltose alpha-D-glucosyltransferase/alpha-amylase
MIDDLWYKNGVFYCLSVGTYMDANGDGIGDFKGLLRRLDYLHGLGVTAIWLMPFQPSPGKDDGYDISDYYGVDPRYGTLGDFVEFTHGCQQRGIRVIVDLVVNHTSDAHPWFRDARSPARSSRVPRLTPRAPRISALRSGGKMGRCDPQSLEPTNTQHLPPMLPPRRWSSHA